MVRKLLIWLAKCIGAGICAIVLLSAFSFFYFNTGRHLENPTGATSFVWEGDFFYCQMREGFSFGRLDEDGFNNTEKPEKTDILLMGSSFMEGINLCQKDLAVSRLNEKLQQEGMDLTAYSIGLSAHSFFICAGNLEAALEEYSPKYLILEMDALPCEEYSAQQVLDGTASYIPSYTGLRFAIQKDPLSKLAVQQFREFQYMPRSPLSCNLAPAAADAPAFWETLEDSEDIQYIGPVQRQMFAELGRIAEEHGTTLILLFHPALILHEDGSASPCVLQASLNEFTEVCSSSGIIMADMGPAFMEAYNERHVLPDGFCNTAPESGHMNANGHEAVAEQIFELISSAERNAENP